MQIIWTMSIQSDESENLTYYRIVKYGKGDYRFEREYIALCQEEKLFQICHVAEDILNMKRGSILYSL